MSIKCKCGCESFYCSGTQSVSLSIVFDDDGDITDEETVETDNFEMTEFYRCNTCGEELSHEKVKRPKRLRG